MAKAIPSTVRADLATGKPLTESRIRALRDWDRIIQRRPMHIHVPAASTTSNSLAVLEEFKLFVPDYADTQLALRAEAFTDSKGGFFALRDAASGNAGGEVVISALSYTDVGPAYLTIDSTWLNTNRTMQIVARAEVGATVTLRVVDYASLYFEDNE